LKHLRPVANIKQWMIFCSTEEVNDLWGVIAHATANNELGIAAKVALFDEGDDRKPRLLCIYTQDFNDVEDVARVAQKLRSLGVIKAGGKSIYYKCGTYTSKISWA
jgi:hypothetical protein